MMRLTEELQQHVHSDLCSEVNQMIIDLKLNSSEIFDNTTDEQRVKIIEARGKRPSPSAIDVITLLSKVRDEMNECKQPFRKR
jgi:hypothetical protein